MLRWLSITVCLAACQWTPGYPTSESCPEYTGPTYQENGAPTRCYVLAAMQTIEPRVKECPTPADGIVRVAFEFDARGTARKVHAELECHSCRSPSDVDATEYLKCVERAAKAAQVVPSPELSDYSLTYPFWVKLDPRLKLGWAPMDPGTQ